MKRLLFSLVSVIILTSCETDTNHSTQLFDFIPPNTSVILKANNFESLNIGLENK